MPRAPSTKRPANPRERQALSRERLKKAGGRVITVRLDRDAARRLDGIQDVRGGSVADAIGHALWVATYRE